MIARRTFVAGAAALAGARAIAAQPRTKGGMFGLIGSMSAKPGKRDELVTLLTDGISGMPGCLSYIVALDPDNADLIWITEVWDSKESHAASLSLPAVRAAITKARPIIGGMGESRTTIPVGGHGLIATAT